MTTGSPPRDPSPPPQTGPAGPGPRPGHGISPLLLAGCAIAGGVIVLIAIIALLTGNNTSAAAPPSTPPPSSSPIPVPPSSIPSPPPPTPTTPAPAPTTPSNSATTTNPTSSATATNPTSSATATNPTSSATATNPTSSATTTNPSPSPPPGSGGSGGGGSGGVASILPRREGDFRLDSNSVQPFPALINIGATDAVQANYTSGDGSATIAVILGAFSNTRAAQTTLSTVASRFSQHGCQLGAPFRLTQGNRRIGSAVGFKCAQHDVGYLYEFGRIFYSLEGSSYSFVDPFATKFYNYIPVT